MLGMDTILKMDVLDGVPRKVCEMKASDIVRVQGRQVRKCRTSRRRKESKQVGIFSKLQNPQGKKSFRAAHPGVRAFTLPP